MTRRLSGRAAAWVLLWAAVGLAAAAVEIPPAPTRWATDKAGFLSPATVRSLDESLERFERETGHQVLVYIGRTTGGESIQEFGVRAFAAWKVGRKGLDDGLVLFVMAEDRRVGIEVGYGLEAVVPDIVAGRIINDILVPKIRAGDPDAGVREAVAALTEAVAGQDALPPAGAGSPSNADKPASRPRGSGGAGQTLLLAIGAVVFLVILITNPRLALWLLFNILSGDRGGGGGFGGGGGGFRGGGGRSGGGGASGGW
jgi:uncharacterized protein